MALIDPPPDAVAELPQYRTLHSKRFDLGNGFHRIIHRLGRVHYQADDGTLQDIDTTINDDGQGNVTATALPFRFTLLKQGIGYAFQSRSGGTVIVQLRRVGGAAVSTTNTFTFTRNGNRVVFADVATDLDIIIQVNRNGVQAWRRLKSASAAKSWRWGIKYDAAGQQKIDPTIRGIDGGSPIRVLNGLAISDSAPQDNGDGTFTILRDETWDGTVITVDPQTRVKSVTSDPVYPVLIGPDVTDHISSDADDGYEFGGQFQGISGDKGTDRMGGYFQGYNPGWRFQNITVSQGATISLAQLKVNVVSNSGTGGSCTVWGAAEDNGHAWAFSSYLPSTRTKTTHSSSFPRSATGIATITVTSIIQDIVSRAGWSSGNAIVLFGINAEATGGSAHTSQLEDYHNAGTSEAVLEITLAAAGGGTAPRMIAGGEHLGLLLWEASGIC